MISKETIQNILDHARVEEVVGDFVNLKRAGANLKGNCPFHDEKTPSFVVSPAKNIYKCFGCGAAGDPLKFIMEHEQMNYPEALRYLAKRYQIEVVEDNQPFNEEAKEQQTFKDSLFIAMKFASKYYHDTLLESVEGKAIGLSYFKQRGFSSKTIEDFQLGYAPDGFEVFTKHAQESGYQIDILEKSGLIKVKEGRSPYDFFRGRVMFPIHNLSGKVVAFGGRILSSDVKQAKYINTPETDIYTKGNLVYGIYQAKNDIRKLDACFLVEGYTDVLSLHQAGIHNVVASSGTALTKEQIKLIKRFTQNIILIYDGDKAGIQAALRGVDIMLEEEMDVRVVILPDGEDPDSFVKNRGTDQTLEFIDKNKKDFIFFKADILLKDTNNDPVLKSNAIHQIVETIAIIKDPIRKAYYTRECSKIAQLSEDILIKEVNKTLIKLQRQNKQIREADAVVARELIEFDSPFKEQTPVPTPEKDLHIQEKDVLRILFMHGHRVLPDGKHVATMILDHTHDVPFQNSNFQKIFDQYLKSYDNEVPFEELGDDKHYTDEEVKEFIIGLNISPYQLSPNWESQHNIIVKNMDRLWESDVESTMNRFSYHKILQELKSVDEKIKESSNNDNFEEIIKLLEKKQILQAHKKEVAKKQGTVIF
ncbi:MAG TPA: DNA primase [Chitinophagales bacterium]|nr:DNA primase [Chitinophagales bacterium]